MKAIRFSLSLIVAGLAPALLAQNASEVAASSSTGAAKPGNAAVLEAEAYVTPPSAIADFVNAPRHKNITLSNLSPRVDKFLISESNGMPTLAEIGKPWHNLAGDQFDPAANRSRSLSSRVTTGFTLLDWKTGVRTAIETPKGATVASPAWSPDGSKLAFFVLTENNTQLAVADTATGKSRIVAKASLLATLVTRPEWSADGKSLFAVFVPDSRGVEPKEPAVAAQPIVRLTEPTKNRTRTYRSLIENTHGQALYEYYATGQLAKVDAASGKIAKVGQPAMYRSIDPSPDGMFVRVTKIQKPFSYIVPSSNWGALEEIVDLAGAQLVEVQKRSLRVGSGPSGDDSAPTDERDGFFSEQDELQGRGGNRGGGGQGPSGGSGRRSLTWAADGQGLTYLQLEPTSRREGGESQSGPQPGRKDRLMRWLPPFGAENAKPIYETEGSILSAQFGSDGKTLFVNESRSGQTAMYAISLEDPSKKTTLWSERTPSTTGAAAGAGRAPGTAPQAPDNFYDNRGSLVTRSNALGVSTVRVSPGGEVFLSGTQYSRNPEQEAPRPFVDAVSLADGKKRRVWQSSPDIYETITAWLDDEASQFVVTRQSRTLLPNSYLVTVSGGEPKALTQNVDYALQVSIAQRHRIRVQRADGFKFWVEVTLPADWKSGDRLPAFFWFYPREYTDQATYDRGGRTFNKNAFPNTGHQSKELLVLMGYALVEPDCPIVGPTGRMNDFYVHDLRNNMSATIDELDRRGFIDRSRLGIGGHSYGAFSTVNAMVHTPFFKAGIAGDGAYNRVLTPMAFQSEQRVLWEARETYLTMSPMLYAEQLTGALLMYHGIEDQNVGTHPINSERLFHALDGLGKTAALYMYPYEDHGQVAKETILDQWARFVAWLDKYVKDAGKEADKP
jgi:dipeptidyl aminopeptidase/acylaminoacyl peptidase